MRVFPTNAATSVDARKNWKQYATSSLNVREQKTKDGKNHEASGH